MKCPLCKNRKDIEIDLHAEGFSQDARECGECGAMWTFSGQVLKIIKGANKKGTNIYSDFICPTCKSILCIETDLDAFQFHEELQECANCGTVCSSAHGHIETVEDSQSGSFLSTTSDLVESDEYVFI